MSDPCECLFSHEALMRRLLNAICGMAIMARMSAKRVLRRVIFQLRDSQTDCTDTECVGPSGGGLLGSNLPMLLALWGIAALALFMTRPASLRRPDPPVPEKPTMRQNGSDREPPPSAM